MLEQRLKKYAEHLDQRSVDHEPNPAPSSRARQRAALAGVVASSMLIAATVLWIDGHDDNSEPAAEVATPVEHPSVIPNFADLPPSEHGVSIAPSVSDGASIYRLTALDGSSYDLVQGAPISEQLSVFATPGQFAPSHVFDFDAPSFYIEHPGISLAVTPTLASFEDSIQHVCGATTCPFEAKEVAIGDGSDAVAYSWMPGLNRAIVDIGTWRFIVVVPGSADESELGEILGSSGWLIDASTGMPIITTSGATDLAVGSSVGVTLVLSGGQTGELLVSRPCAADEACAATVEWISEPLQGLDITVRSVANAGN